MEEPGSATHGTHQQFRQAMNHLQRHACGRRWTPAFAAALGALPLMLAGTLGAQAPNGAAESRREAEYALSVERIADSAIHRLDFFPARLQLRAQMLFLGRRDTAAVVFAALSARSTAAALAVDDVVSAFEGTPVPDDLRQLHGQLLGALRAARAALDRLSRSAEQCAVDQGSVSRCQAPLTSASIAMGKAYARYLDTRRRIAEQILDTKTLLPAFATASARSERGVPRDPPDPAGGPDQRGAIGSPVAFRQEPPYLLSTSYRRDDGRGFIRRP